MYNACKRKTHYVLPKNVKAQYTKQFKLDTVKFHRAHSTLT